MTDASHPGGQPSSRRVPRPRTGPDDDRRIPSPDTDRRGPDHGQRQSTPEPEQLDLDRYPLLAEIPALLDVPATDALVMIPLRHDRPVGLIGRSLTDLYLTDPQTVLNLWGALLGMAVLHGCDQVSIIGYTHPANQSHLDVIRASCPLRVATYALVSEDRWWMLDCPDPHCPRPACRLGGERLAGDQPSTAALHLIHRTTTRGRPWPEDTTHADEPFADGEFPAGPEHPSADGGLRNRWPDPLRLRDLVEAQLPITPTVSCGLNQMIFRMLLDVEHQERLARPDKDLTPLAAALLLQALADPVLVDGCLNWTDAAAGALWCDLVWAAPKPWILPVCALLAAWAYRRGDLAMTQAAVLRGDLEPLPHPLLRVLRRCLQLNKSPDVVGVILMRIFNRVPPYLQGL